MEPEDEINEFIEKMASNARGKASNNIETLQNDTNFKISTQEQKLASYKKHLVLFQKACEQAIYPVSNQSILYNKIKIALESKRVYLDKTFRVWVDYKTKNEVFNGIKSELYKDYADYYTTLELAEIIDAIANGEEDTSRVSNEEFLKGKITISFINGTVPMFTVKKRLETRNLAAVTYIDAYLNNWVNAIEKENEYDKKLEILHNARLTFSTFKYNYPPLEKQVNRAIARLDGIEPYLKFWQSKPKSKDFGFIYFLRRYIDIAVRYQINPATLMVLKGNYENARYEGGKFIQEFRTQKLSLNDVEKGNLYIDLKGEFYPMIDLYIVFYNKNIAIIKQAVNEPYPVGQNPYSYEINPYSVLFDLCNDTKKEIEKLNTYSELAPDKKGKEIKQIDVTEHPKLNLEKCLAYINSIEDFKVYTELSRDKGKGFAEFLKMGRAVSFEEDIWKGLDEIFEIGMKIKRENENLSILMKPVSIKEVLKKFVIECKKQFEITGSNFLQWLDTREFYYRKFQKDKVTEINTELKKAKVERKEKLELAKDKYIQMVSHYYHIIELIKNDVLNNAINPNVQAQEKKKITKPLSYTWNGKHNTAKTMFRLLKDEGCIPENIDINNFLYVFTGKPKVTLPVPIKWSKSNRLLAYLLFSLYRNGLINDTDWQSKAEKGKFFTTTNDKPITANDLARAVSDCNKFEVKPDNFEIVDSILTTLISKQ